MFECRGENKMIEYIICGLGNPGTGYADTRHNAGFMAVDNIADSLNCKVKKLKFKSLTGECAISGKGCLLMKPGTFMNCSGEAVTEAMNFYKIPPERTIILFDDITKEAGEIRIRRKGSDGGHNGMKNIIYLKGTDKFPRIKIGIGDKPHKDYDLSDWVLSRFTKEEGVKLEQALDNTREAVKLLVAGEFDKAMTLYN
jgi:PTH1 family peptidyl-tRNA hydrolase